MPKKIVRNKRPVTGPNAPIDNTNNQPKNLSKSLTRNRAAKHTKATNKITRRDLFRVVFDSLQPGAKSDKDSLRDQLIRQYLNQKLSEHDVSTNYNLLILYDEGIMLRTDADYIYSAANSFPQSKPILLILYSNGGEIGPAYLIGQLCREYAKDKFIVTVPRQAKSSATLLCCAADEIHMGSLSELGPIDPQIEEMPALGLKASVTHICDLVKENPHAADMFSKYLNLSLDPVQLGYYERVAESAAQYAERLLEPHASNLKQEPVTTAKLLVYSYKDHGFVIDKKEALHIFGDKTIKTNTPEYTLGNAIYEELNFIAEMADYLDHSFYIIGSADSPLHFIKRVTSS